MKHTQKDMTLGLRLPCSPDPAKVPFTFTLDGKRYCGFPQELHPRTDLVRIDALVTLHRFTAFADGLQLIAERYDYRDFAVCEWVMYIENASDRDSARISDWRFCTEIAAETAAEPATLYHGNGDTCNPSGYTWQTDALGAQPLHIEPCGDGTSCNGAFPYMRLLFGDWGINLAIGWSGHWSADLALEDGCLRLSAGQAIFDAYLKPGERARSPRVTMQAFDGGHDRGRNLWRSFYFAHVLPREKDGRPLSPKLFLHTWMIDGKSEFSGTTEQNQIDSVNTYLQKGFTPDVWWMDAGWYPCNYNWVEGVGNWYVNPENYPRGFAPVTEHLHKNGIDFLLWFEPERVYRNSRLWREHPDFLLFYKGDNAFLQDNALFNLGDPAACDWLIDKIDGLIKEYGVDVYRQDFNFPPMPYWQENTEPGRAGVLENLHIQGYYRYWDALLARNPGLWIDSCASGGRRNDFETMRRAVPLHYTDVGYGHHPIKQLQHRQMFEWIPYFRAHNYNWCNEQGEYDGGRHPIDAFSYHNAMTPALTELVEFYDDEALFAQGKVFHPIWRRAAEIMLRADYYPLTECRQDARDYCGLQFDEDGAGYVQIMRNVDAPDEAITLSPFVYDAGRTYTFTEAVSGEVRTITGTELAAHGMRFAMPKRSGQIWFYVSE